MQIGHIFLSDTKSQDERDWIEYIDQLSNTPALAEEYLNIIKGMILNVELRNTEGDNEFWNIPLLAKFSTRFLSWSKNGNADDYPGIYNTLNPAIVSMTVTSVTKNRYIIYNDKFKNFHSATITPGILNAVGYISPNIDNNVDDPSRVSFSSFVGTNEIATFTYKNIEWELDGFAIACIENNDWSKCAVAIEYHSNDAGSDTVSTFEGPSFKLIDSFGFEDCINKNQYSVITYTRGTAGSYASIYTNTNDPIDLSAYDAFSTDSVIIVDIGDSSGGQ